MGPLVYGVAYCPVSYQETLDTLGFAGSLSFQYYYYAKRKCLSRLENIDCGNQVIAAHHVEFRSREPGLVSESYQVSELYELWQVVR